MAHENADTERNRHAAEMIAVVDEQIVELNAGRTQQQFILEGLTRSQLEQASNFIQSFGGWRRFPVVEAVANA